GPRLQARPRTRGAHGAAAEQRGGARSDVRAPSAVSRGRFTRPLDRALAVLLDRECVMHRAGVRVTHVGVLALLERDRDGLRALEPGGRDDLVHAGALEMEVVDVGLVADRDRVLARLQRLDESRAL